MRQHILHPRSNSRSTFALALVLATGVVGCHDAPPPVRGTMTADASPVAVSALASTPKAKTVVLTGEMTSKCPAAGCWFMLRDQTGTVRVDTKAAGFVVSDVPDHTRLSVSGTVEPGDTPSLNATGLRVSP